MGGGGGVGGRACAPITPTWSQLPVRPLPSLFRATSRPSTTSPIAGDLLRQHLISKGVEHKTSGGRGGGRMLATSACRESPNREV